MSSGFTAAHYVPLLRCKNAELEALWRLFPRDRAHVTPIIEIPRTAYLPSRRSPKSAQPKPRNPSHVTVNVLARLEKVWKDRPFFLDLRNLKGARFHEELVSLVAAEARKRNLGLIPVASIRDSDGLVKALHRSGSYNGLCIRIPELDLQLADFRDRLRTLLTAVKRRPRTVDLVVDFAQYYEGSPSYADVCAKIPVPESWRSLTILSGDFPKDLRTFTKGTNEPRLRRDWLRWCSEVSHSTMPRSPTFGDYTVQFGRYVEPKPGAIPSASLRYTLDDSWLVMRGEQPTAEGPDESQYLMWARVLRDSPQWYAGPDFSAGDAFIAHMATGQHGFGTPSDWLAVAINHHITKTVRQLCARPHSSDAS